jgi:hypothetical protein
LAAYNGDAGAEAKHHFEELERAAELLHTRFPELTIDCFLVNFEGVFGNGAQAREPVR